MEKSKARGQIYKLASTKSDCYHSGGSLQHGEILIDLYKVDTNADRISNTTGEYLHPQPSQAEIFTVPLVNETDVEETIKRMKSEKVIEPDYLLSIKTTCSARKNRALS